MTTATPIESKTAAELAKHASTLPNGLITKLAGISSELHRLRKRGRNEQDGYSYATEADISAAIRTRLAKRNIVLVPQVDDIDIRMLLTILKMTFTFIDGDSGESLMFRWAGVGADKSDKGVYKAITGAVKYALLKFFLVPTFDDPEHDSVEAPLTVTPEPLPVMIESVENLRGRGAKLRLSDGKSVYVFQPQLIALAEQRSQDRISVIVICKGEWRGKPKCVEIHDANPPAKLDSAVPSVSPEDVVL